MVARIALVWRPPAGAIGVDGLAVMLVGVVTSPSQGAAPARGECLLFQVTAVPPSRREARLPWLSWTTEPATERKSASSLSPGASGSPQSRPASPPTVATAASKGCAARRSHCSPA